MTDPSEGYILALDAATSTGSVAIGRGGRVLAEASINVGAGHSSALLPAIDYVVNAAGADRTRIQGVVVGSGPGSFTGVRIAAATAKGIAGALEVPLFAYSSLLATAGGVAGGGDILVIFDARGRDVYGACYSFGVQVETVVEPGAYVLDELLDRVRGRQITTATGDGLVRHGDELKRSLGIDLAPSHLHSPRGSSLLWLAQRWPGLGRVESARAWEPDYLRASGAERIAAAKKLSEVQG